MSMEEFRAFYEGLSDDEVARLPPDELDACIERLKQLREVLVSEQAEISQEIQRKEARLEQLDAEVTSEDCLEMARLARLKALAYARDIVRRHETGQSPMTEEVQRAYRLLADVEG